MRTKILLCVICSIVGFAFAWWISCEVVSDIEAKDTELVHLVSLCYDPNENIKHYPAETHKTIKVTVITKYCYKFTDDALVGQIDMTAGTGTFAIAIPVGYYRELPFDSSYCKSCIRNPNRRILHFPNTTKGFIRKIIKSTMLRATVETKKITGLKSDYRFRCDKTFWDGTCGNPLTDGCVIVKYKWEIIE